MKIKITKYLYHFVRNQAISECWIQNLSLAFFYDSINTVCNKHHTLFVINSLLLFTVGIISLVSLASAWAELPNTIKHYLELIF